MTVAIDWMTVIDRRFDFRSRGKISGTKGNRSSWVYRQFLNWRSYTRDVGVVIVSCILQKNFSCSLLWLPLVAILFLDVCLLFGEKLHTFLLKLLSLNIVKPWCVFHFLQQLLFRVFLHKDLIESFWFDRTICHCHCTPVRSDPHL
jgi:hypothetical protein